MRDFTSTATIRTIIDMKLLRSAALQEAYKGFCRTSSECRTAPQHLKTNLQWENTLKFKAFSINAPKTGGVKGSLLVLATLRYIGSVR